MVWTASLVLRPAAPHPAAAPGGWWRHIKLRRVILCSHGAPVLLSSSAEHISVTACCPLQAYQQYKKSIQPGAATAWTRGGVNIGCNDAAAACVYAGCRAASRRYSLASLLTGTCGWLGLCCAELTRQQTLFDGLGEYHADWFTYNPLAESQYHG
jgi:hypothetical protein